MYAKIENDKIIYAPKNYNTGKNLILNFNKNIELMKQCGFKKVIDNKPHYDNSVQYITDNGYVENSDNIIIKYIINEIEEIQEPTLEERVIHLEKIITEQSELIKTLFLTLNS